MTLAVCVCVWGGGGLLPQSTKALPQNRCCSSLCACVAGAHQTQECRTGVRYATDYRRQLHPQCGFISDCEAARSFVAQV